MPLEHMTIETSIVFWYLLDFRFWYYTFFKIDKNFLPSYNLILELQHSLNAKALKRLIVLGEQGRTEQTDKDIMIHGIHSYWETFKKCLSVELRRNSQFFLSFLLNQNVVKKIGKKPQTMRIEDR